MSRMCGLAESHGLRDRRCFWGPRHRLASRSPDAAARTIQGKDGFMAFSRPFLAVAEILVRIPTVAAISDLRVYRMLLPTTERMLPSTIE